MFDYDSEFMKPKNISYPLYFLLPFLLSLEIIGCSKSNINVHEENDTKRINDLIHIAELIEEYHSIKGSYPLIENNGQDVNVPIATVEVKWDIPTKSARELNKDLAAVIGHAITLPTDPVGYEASKGRRVYQYYSNGKMYAVSTHLYFPTEYTRKLGENSHKFQISSLSQPDYGLVNLQTAKSSKGGRKIIREVQAAFFESMFKNDINGMQQAVANGAILDFPCNKNEICKPLARAITQDLDVNTIKFLIENGANLNGRNAYNDTPLIFALMDEKFEVVDLLLEAGADVNQANFFGATPFFGVCANGNLEQVKKFYKYGGRVTLSGNHDRGTKCNNIPLIAAVEGGYYEVAKFLIDNGADPYKKNSKDISAASLIKKMRKDNFEALLLNIKQ